MKEDEINTEKVHCNKCLQKTKHSLVAERINAESQCINESAGLYIEWSTTYAMLECCGCKNVTLRRRYYFSEWDDIEEEYYPPVISRNLPRWHEELPTEIREILREIYTALHADSRRLVLMGTRAIIDLFMTYKVGDIGGFRQKIDELEKKGFLNTKNREVLEAALQAGHAAVHRGHRPDQNEVEQVIDIMENLIHSYVLEDSAKNLISKTPARIKH